MHTLVQGFAACGPWTTGSPQTTGDPRTMDRWWSAAKSQVSPDMPYENQKTLKKLLFMSLCMCHIKKPVILL